VRSCEAVHQRQSSLAGHPSVKGESPHTSGLRGRDVFSRLLPVVYQSITGVKLVSRTLGASMTSCKVSGQQHSWQFSILANRWHA